MELRAFIYIFFLHKKLFVGIILASVVCGIGVFLLQQERYDVSLTLNIARAGEIPKSSEHYAAYYRLQADERFAETVVRWLQSPRIVEDVIRTVGDNPKLFSEKKLRIMFRAVRVSSQVVDVRFTVPNQRDATAYAEAILAAVNAQTGTLNLAEEEPQWFRVLGEDPVVRPHEKSLFYFTALALLAGLFLAFVAVVFWHYYNEGEVAK
jgi:uncharacterized protein involved in exopolysaccharide biosynthesis